MSIIKKDYSATCDLNDENPNNDCWGCDNFLFPIGCMVLELKTEEGLRDEIRKM